MSATRQLARLPAALRKPRNAYKHGDLARALVTAGLAQLEVHGADALSLREAARAAGVSPMAAYHHFRDKRALLAAIAAAGFVEFTARQQTAVASAASAEDALLALGRCYVASARAHPELFRLMVGRGLAGARSEALDAAVAQAFAVSCNAVACAQPGLDPPAVRASAARAWALAHGVAALLVDGVLRPEQLGFADDDALADALLGSPTARGRRAKKR